MDPYRTPSVVPQALAEGASSVSRFGFAGKCFGASFLVAFFLYFVVSYIRMGNTGGDGYIMVPLAALIVACLSWVVSLSLFSFAKTSSTVIVAVSIAAIFLSLAYLFLIGAFATNPLIVKPSIPFIIISLLVIPIAAGLISALRAIRQLGMDSRGIAG